MFCDENVFNKDGTLKIAAEETTEASEVDVTTIGKLKKKKMIIFSKFLKKNLKIMKIFYFRSTKVGESMRAIN